jgi:hypothetical protein
VTALDEAAAALQKFALIERETIKDKRDPATTTDSIRLHRLVREVAAGRPPEEQAESMRRALITALATAYPNDGYNNPASRPRCALLTAHVLAICESETADTNSQCATLLNGAGSFFHGLAAHSFARALFERALAIREKVLGPEHPFTANSLSNLALLLRDQGELAGVRPRFERAAGNLREGTWPRASLHGEEPQHPRPIGCPSITRKNAFCVSAPETLLKTI